jgi:hypothetical protein
MIPREEKIEQSVPNYSHAWSLGIRDPDLPFYCAIQDRWDLNVK